MTVKLLTEHHLEFLNLKACCTGSSESIYVKLSHCWKSHVAAHIYTTSITGSGKEHSSSVLALRSRGSGSSLTSGTVWYLLPRHFVLCFEQVQFSVRPCPEVITLFSYSAQLRTKFILLINVKMPTIV